MVYSNPRTEALFTDWPYGNKRCKAQFTIEDNKGKQRAVRLTQNPKTGRWNNPKKTTYSYNVCFMDGDDGRIYIVQDTGNCFSIMKSDMQHTHETVYEDHPQYRIIVASFNEMRERELAAANS